MDDKLELINLQKDYKPKDLIILKYDAFTERTKALAEIQYTPNAKPPMQAFRTTPERREAEVEDWYERRLETIAAVERRFRGRLENARRAGQISEDDYMKQLMEAQSPLSDFAQERRRVHDDYLNIKK